MSFALVGCPSLPKVNPPDSLQLLSDVEGQPRQFKGFTPQQVLSAAEDVLRRHQPEAKFVRSADTLKMDSHHVGFVVIAGWESEERWAVHAREEEQITVASVAMDVRSAGAVFFSWQGSHRVQYPSKAVKTIFGTIPAYKISYDMFWQRVQSILTDAPWPECVKVSDIRVSDRRVSDRRVSDGGPHYIDPLCLKENGVFD
jgi:hypothetical protein